MDPTKEIIHGAVAINLHKSPILSFHLIEEFSRQCYIK